MTEIIRSWLCLNARCSKEFTAWEAHPACPSCKCVRVNWVPGGGHVAGTSRAADAELRTLADNYGLTDMNSARRGERAKPALVQPHVDQRSAPAMQFAPGFSAVPHPAQAVCVPSSSKVNFRAKVGMDAPLSRSRSVPGVHSATHFEGRHVGARTG